MPLAEILQNQNHKLTRALSPSSEDISKCFGLRIAWNGGLVRVTTSSIPLSFLFSKAISINASNCCSRTLPSHKPYISSHLPLSFGNGTFRVHASQIHCKAITDNHLKNRIACFVAVMSKPRTSRGQGKTPAASNCAVSVCSAGSVLF